MAKREYVHACLPQAFVVRGWRANLSTRPRVHRQG